MNKTFLVILMLVVFAFNAKAETITVDVANSPPSVIVDQDTGEVSGVDIDLWKEIYTRINSEKYDRYEFNPVKFRDIFRNVNEEGHYGMAGISVKSDRLSLVDFSQPYMNSGKLILVQENSISVLKTLWSLLVESDIVKIITIFMAFVVFCAHAAWFLERGKDSINDKYSKGIWESMYWVITTSTTVGYGDIAPKNWQGRLFSIFVMFSGIAFFGWALAEMTSELTNQKSAYTIESPEDFEGKNIATSLGTTSVAAIKREGGNVIGKHDIKDAFYELLLGNVDAVVADAPVIQYYNNNKAKGKTAIVGHVFDEENYAIAIPHGSPLKRDIDKAILEIKEDGTFDTILAKWGLK